MSAIKRVLSLSAAFAAALNGTMVMPLIVLALSRIPGIDEATATAIAAAELAGIAIYGLFAARLVRRSRRLVVAFGLLAMIGGEAASQYLDGIPLLVCARLLAGLGEGALFSLVSAAVACESNAERIWGQINVVGGVAMGLLLYGLSLLPITNDRGSIFLWLAAMGVVMAPWVMLIRAGQGAVTTAPPKKLARSRMGLIWLVIVLVYGFQAGQWAVSGYMGALDHMSNERVGLFLALSSILGFAGALVPSLTRNPAHRLRFVLQGFTVMALAGVAFFNWQHDQAFLWGQVGVNVGFYMVTPFVIGLLTESDSDGSLVLRTLVIALIGAAVGTALAGELFTDAGPRIFSLVCVVILGVGMLAAWPVFRRLHESAAVPTSNNNPEIQA